MGENGLTLLLQLRLQTAVTLIKKITNAIKKAVDAGVISTFTFPNQYRLKLYQRIHGIFFDVFNEGYKSHFLSGGSEAVECALDLALSFKSKKRSVVVSFFNAFHGNTCRSDLISGTTELLLIKQNDEEVIFIKVPFVSRLQVTNSSFLSLLTTAFSKNNLSMNDLVAIVIEPYQGRGVFVLDDQFAQQIGDFCKESKVLLIVDEIQTGFFRTGKLFASQYFRFSPDIICLGKGLSSSLPISAVVAKSKIFDQTPMLEVLTTQSANPICCAAALANIDFLMSDNFHENLAVNCKIFKENLESLRSESVVYVDSFGLAGSIHLAENGLASSRLANSVVSQAFKKGLLLNAPNGQNKSFIRLTPPLSISQKGLESGFNILKDTLRNVGTI